MRKGMALASVLCLAWLTAFSQAGGTKTSVDGVWVPESATVNGKKLTADQVKDIKLSIKGTSYTIHKGDKLVTQGTFKMDNTKNPRQIDVTTQTPDGKTRKVQGIYKLEGNLLTVCGVGEGKARPTDFTSAEGSGRELVVYRRQK